MASEYLAQGAQSPRTLAVAKIPKGAGAIPRLPHLDPAPAGGAAGALRGYQDPPRGSLQLTLLRFIKCRLGIPITQYFGKFASVSAVHVGHQIMPNTIAARNTNDIIVASTFNLVLISIVAS
jgi:hypothetical protein